MGLWIFMLVMDLLIPFSMIGFGRYLMKRAPKEINNVFGYRTSLSMKNRDTWEFANRYCGRLWYICGLASLPVSVIWMLLVMGKTETALAIMGCVLCGVQILLMVGAILPTESALKKTFDKYGKRK